MWPGNKNHTSGNENGIMMECVSQPTHISICGLVQPVSCGGARRRVVLSRPLQHVHHLPLLVATGKLLGRVFIRSARPQWTIQLQQNLKDKDGNNRDYYYYYYYWIGIKIRKRKNKNKATTTNTTKLFSKQQERSSSQCWLHSNNLILG